MVLAHACVVDTGAMTGRSSSLSSRYGPVAGGVLAGLSEGTGGFTRKNRCVWNCKRNKPTLDRNEFDQELTFRPVWDQHFR